MVGESHHELYAFTTLNRKIFFSAFYSDGIEARRQVYREHTRFGNKFGNKMVLRNIPIESVGTSTIRDSSRRIGIWKHVVTKHAIEVGTGGDELAQGPAGGRE